MRKLYSILRGFFAIIGILFSVAIILFWAKKDDFTISVDSLYSLYEQRVDTLRAAGSFEPDTANFSFTIIQDTLQAKKIKEYFCLDTLYSGFDDTWTKALAIGNFVATNIPHANQTKWPEQKNAIGLWEYTRDVEPAFNCRLHSILTFELLLAADIPARFVTCLPQDKDDNDCHVVNEVWLPEKQKWVMLDTDMGGHYVTDKQGNLLSLREIREHYVGGKKMLMYPEFKNGSNKMNYYYAYLAKDTYWFQCWGTMSYFQEEWNKEDVVRNSYIVLVPKGFEPFNIGGGNTITTNADLFWSEPKILLK